MSADALQSKPLQGKRIGIITDNMSKGVAPGVATAVQASIAHLESLGAQLDEVRCTWTGLAELVL